MSIINIIIKTITGKIIRLGIESTKTVGDLKQAISDNEGLEIGWIRLEHIVRHETPNIGDVKYSDGTIGKVLRQDQIRLDEIGVGEGSIFQLMLMPKFKI